MTSTTWVDSLLRGQTPSWAEIGASRQGVLDSCQSFEVDALVHDRLARGQPGHDWPLDVCRELEHRSHAAAARELVRNVEIQRVLEQLAARQIFPIVFKGAALAYVVYDSPAARPHADVDLLVAREQIETVRTVLSAAGYQEPPLSDGELLFCQFQMTNCDRFGIRHVFDIHWKISTQTLFADVLTYDEIAAESVPLTALGCHARTTSAPHALILACIHPVMHHRNYPRLIWLCDIDRLARRMSAEALRRFAAIAVDRGVAHICLRQLQIVAERLGTPLSNDVMTMLATAAAAEPSAAYLRPGRRWHHELVSNLRSLSRWRDRVRLVREVVLPSPQYMLDIYHLRPAARAVLPVLYLHRCLSGLVKIARKQK